MDNEAIPTDVSDADPAVIAGELAPEAAPEVTPEVTPEAEQEQAPSSDPVSRRERKMADLAEKRKEEQAVERKTAFLINEPETTEEEYDAKLAAAQESPSTEAPAGDEAIPPAGEGEGAPSTEHAGDDLPATPPNGWRTNDDGVRVKTLMVNGEARDITEEQ